MNEHEKYILQEKLRMDKEQTLLSKKGCSPNTKFYAVKRDEIKFDEKVLCPFCFKYEEFSKFNHKGNLYECPECHNKLTFKTCFDIRKMDALKFAKWVFDYRLSGFWDKIINKDFKEWNNRLYGVSFGFGKEFWDEYKNLKGSNYNYEDGD